MFLQINFIFGEKYGNIKGGNQDMFDLVKKKIPQWIISVWLSENSFDTQK